MAGFYLPVQEPLNLPRACCAKKEPMRLGQVFLRAGPLVSVDNPQGLGAFITQRHAVRLWPVTLQDSNDFSRSHKIITDLRRSKDSHLPFPPPASNCTFRERALYIRPRAARYSRHGATWMLGCDPKEAYSDIEDTQCIT
jgi:hypothetical protein